MMRLITGLYDFFSPVAAKNFFIAAPWEYKMALWSNFKISAFRN